MTVRVNKSSFNIREKLSELERPIGLKGSELMKAETAQDARDFVSAGRKNLIINGRFDFWQRGTSFTGDEYTADRWRQALSGGTSTVSRQSFTLGQTEVPGNPVYYLRQSCSVGNGNCGIDQKIEDVRTGAGGPVTVSFWAKGTNPPGYGYWAMQLWQRFGTGGSPSGAVRNDKELTVTSEWKKYTFTYELESVSGKTLGTNNDHNVDLIIRQHENDNNTGAWELNLANVQVEFGRNATEFEHRSYGEELALCQRYFQGYNAATSDLRASTGYENYDAEGATNVNYTTLIGTGTVLDADDARIHFTLPVSMRAKPTVSGVDLRLITATTLHNSTTTIQDSSSTIYAISLLVDNGGGMTAGQCAHLIIKGNGNFFIDAEL